jgi:large subunit ribosomal protein L24
MKLHAGDTVLIISGKDRGKTGSILRVLPTEGRVVVAGINMRTRHVKKTYQEAGRKVRYEASISASNVMILDPKTKKPSRIGFKVDAKGHKKRVSKVSGDEVTTVRLPKEKKKKDTKGSKETEVTKVTEVTEAKKKTSATSVPSETSATSKKSTPFWQRMKFGAAAMTDADVAEQPRSKQDHSVPSQESHVRSAGRGS